MQKDWLLCTTVRDPEDTKILSTTFEWRKVKQSFINLDDQIFFAASAKNFEIFRLEYFYLIYIFFSYQEDKT